MTTDAKTWLALACCALLGCPLSPPPDPLPIDCDQIDRAAERFPEECGEPEDADAGVEVDSGEE